MQTRHKNLHPFGSYGQFSDLLFFSSLLLFFSLKNDDCKDVFERALNDRIDENERALKRVSCCEGIVVRMYCMEVRMDQDLDRRVVELNTFGRFSVIHTWNMVDRGKWEVALRLRLCDYFPQSGSDLPSMWSVRFQGEAGEGKAVVNVGSQWWRMVQQMMTPADIEKDLRVDWEMTDTMVATGWIKITLPVFTMVTQGQVTFHLLGTGSNGSIVFDFVELRKVD